MQDSIFFCIILIVFSIIIGIVDEIYVKLYEYVDMEVENNENS